MKKTSPRFGRCNLHTFFILLFFSAGAALAIVSFVSKDLARGHGPMLRVETLNFHATSSQSTNQFENVSQTATAASAIPNAPTFGHPIIAGIGGAGFEESVRIDPTNPDRIYTSAPGTLSADTSWVWHSLDGGKTFKWVVGAAPLEGKVTTCHGGGDSEIAVDSAGHLYFNDLTLPNFSTARSDDFGATFTCSNTGVPDAAVDRQWYAVDGDPTNGGVLYLANDEIGPGGVTCSSPPPNNVLVMYRSPAAGLDATAGIEFGPANHITAVNGCDEAIMGNNEISPVATTLGQPNGTGGYATLPTPVKHVFVIHDNVALNKILLGRCFPVAFGLPVANVSDPSGLNCTDLPVADLGPNQKTGANFPTLAIDKVGNLYAVWEQAPIGPDTNATGDVVVTGDTVLKYSYSTDQGNTWSAPIPIDTSGSPDGILHNNVFAWINAGDDGRVNIVWYGTPSAYDPGGAADLACGQNVILPPPGGKNLNGPDAVTNGLWSVWMVQSLNAHDPSGVVFTAPVRASAHHIHRGPVQTLIGGQCGWASRALGDYLQLRTGPQGEAHISYADSNSIVGSIVGHAMYVRQNAGTGLFVSPSLVNIPGITPYNAVTDPSGDGKYEAAGISSANMPQLDILNSSITKVTDAPCSVADPCYKVFMQVNNLSLSPTTAQDPDPDLVWQTQWFVPSTTDGNGGKDFHVYAESFNGAALQCFVGENDVQLVGGGGVLTYPGTTQLPDPNCQSTLGPNGTITIYVPLSSVNEGGLIDTRLHEVTAATMTLPARANSEPRDPLLGTGGVFFNLIDVAQAYVFDPAPVLTGVVSRKIHGALTPPADLPLTTTGPATIECRSGGIPSGNHTLVFTFANPLNVSSPVSSINATATNSSGIQTVSASPSVGTNIHELLVTLSDVPNASHVSVTLTGVTDAVGAVGDFAAHMDVLLGDVNSTGRTDAGDVTQVRNRTVTIPDTTDPASFRYDVNVSGRIDAGDVTTTRSATVTVLP